MNSTNKNKKIISQALRISGYIFEGVVACLLLLIVSGCQTLNSKFGTDRTDYSQACELPPLKLPPGSLALSKRYEIPEVAGNKDLIITDNVPPDYYLDKKL
jgi:uncharacterized lipoprotein